MRGSERENEPGREGERLCASVCSDHLFAYGGNLGRSMVDHTYIEVKNKIFDAFFVPKLSTACRKRTNQHAITCLHATVMVILTYSKPNVYHVRIAPCVDLQTYVPAIWESRWI